MQLIKRVEIIIDEMHAPLVIEASERAGIAGHTKISGATGCGDRGRRGGDDLSSLLSNACIIVACQPELLDRLCENIRPILERHGGVCMVSDAMWLKH